MGFWFFWFILIGLLLVWSAINEMKKENKELKKRLDDLAKATGYEELSSNYVEESLKSELAMLKSKGEDIQAVKLLREKTGMGLVPAKQFIDDLE